MDETWKTLCNMVIFFSESRVTCSLDLQCIINLPVFHLLNVAINALLFVSYLTLYEG